MCLGPYHFPAVKNNQYSIDMSLLADAVGQSLSTRPDIIGAEMTKVEAIHIFVLFYISS